MRSPVTVVRQWLGLPTEPDPERQDATRRLAEMERRLARIDASLPNARWHQVYPHPHRQAGDR